MVSRLSLDKSVPILKLDNIDRLRGYSKNIHLAISIDREEQNMSSNNFDHDEMLQFSISAIQEFAADHQEEVFYGFSIDASMLCFNSEQKFSERLTNYQSENLEYYSKSEEIQDLRINTGDWEYQGFVDLRDSGGFDDEAYDEHYLASDEDQKLPDQTTSSGCNCITSYRRSSPNFNFSSIN